MKTVTKFQALLALILVVILQTASAQSNEFRVKYSVTEALKLEEFRRLVNADLYKDSMKTDEFLIRWLRDTDYNLNRAAQKLRKSVEWKNAHKIDDLDIKDLNSTFPIVVSGYDRSGSPIYTVPFGNFDLRRLVLANMGRKFIRHLDAMLEQGLRHTDTLRSEGKNVTQWILVTDTAGLNTRQHLCIGCLALYSEFIVDYEGSYPGTIKNIIIINAPRIFERVFAVAKPLMSRATRVGFRTFANKADWQEWFLGICDPDQLVTRYGGIRDRL